MNCPYSRRRLLQQGLKTTALLCALPIPERLLSEEEGSTPIITPITPPVEVEDRSEKAPALPVAIERCADFDVNKVSKALMSLFDKIGGIEKLLKGKTVTVKLNTTGNGKQRLKGRPAERTYQVHPNVVEALCGLFARAGAKKIYLVESFYENKPPEEIYASQGWNISRIQGAADHLAS